MHHKSISDVHCSVAQCLDVVGEWWSRLIVRDTFLGVSRFDQFQERLGISRHVLNLRLARSVDAGILEKVPYPAAPDGPPRQLVHRSCGRVAHAVPTCSACGPPLGGGETRNVPGPGAVEALVGSTPGRGRP